MKKNNVVRSVIIAVVLLAIVLVVFIFHDKIYGATSVFAADPARKPIVNTLIGLIPAIIASVCACIMAYYVYFVIKFVIKLLFDKVSSKAKTVMTLFKSIIKWVLIVATGIIILTAFGVDTKTLIAGLGILALIIGLGAQQLVADIIAGFFIVFESEFAVGDIVTIDGWRGTIIDIGIRVTKLVDSSNNIKIVNNSDIRNVVNLTTENSVAYLTVSIDYGEDLNKVELLIRDNLAKIKADIPAIIDGPYYKGVTAMSASSVDLMLVATCKETDIYQVKRDVNRAIFLLFNEYGVTIPFNQITVSNRVEPTQEYKKKNAKESAHSGAAKKFLEKQTEESKQYDKENET